MDYLNHLTNTEIFIIGGIAFALTLIIPRLRKRKRIMKIIYDRKHAGQTLQPSDFEGKDSLFWTHNAKKNEIEIFLVNLKKYALKHSMKIVFPGNIRFQGSVSPTTMILVGCFGLLLIRCYGFGGQIYYKKSSRCWLQNMNGNEKVLPDPVKSMTSEELLMRRALQNTEYNNVRVFTASVFTRNDVILDHDTGERVYDRNGFGKWLENNPIFEEDSGVNVSRLSNYLVDLVKNGK